jgi:hypothetical protein
VGGVSRLDCESPESNNFFLALYLVSELDVLCKADEDFPTKSPL